MSTKQTEALKLALEALEASLSARTDEEDFAALDLMLDARKTIKSALASEALAEPTTTENNGGKTGWPPGLLQDDCKGLSKWLASRPDARRRVREALAEQPAQQELEELTTQRDFLADILTRTANALKGQPAELSAHSWHDLPEVAQQIKAAQQQQEPVAWMYVNRSTHETVFQKHMRSFVDHSQWKEAPLYGEPLANHELQCVCGAVWCGDEMVHLPNKRPPASKPWVGLTQQDIDIAFDDTQEGGGFNEFARAIEAKLKEKNNG